MNTSIPTISLNGSNSNYFGSYTGVRQGEITRYLTHFSKYNFYHMLMTLYY